MANLDLTESHSAQDGSLVVVDSHQERRRFRVSILPSLHGEKAVLRLVGHASSIPPISGLGLTDRQANTIHQLLQSTQGPILITGPTGSGKSVTEQMRRNVQAKVNAAKSARKKSGAISKKKGGNNLPPVLMIKVVVEL